MKYVLAPIEAAAWKLRVTGPALSGVRRLVVTVAWQTVAFAAAALYQGLAGAGLPAWAVMVAGAGLQAVEKTVRERNA